MSPHLEAAVIDILLVEDNLADIRLTQEVLKDCKVLNRLNVVRDGAQVMPYLYRESPYEDAPQPDLILLDLNLPRKHGSEVLTEIKQDPKFKTIPVIILTTSEEDADILESYSSYANSFVTKPLNLDQFVRVAQAIENFWLGIVRLPPRSES